MESEEMEFEMEQAQRFFGGVNKKAGYLVTTKKGLIGRTYHHEEDINGKMIVHTEKGKLLCSQNTLKLNGYVD